MLNQVVKQGTLRVEAGSGKAEIVDTIKWEKVHLHKAKMIKGKMNVGEEVKLSVNRDIRIQTRNNHSATHLLHSALHAVVGKHALQKGSAVNHERLRFDFQNNKALTEEEIEKIENIVNDWIRENSSGKTEVLEYRDALEAGALALFGENYEEKVRVVTLVKTLLSFVEEPMCLRQVKLDFLLLLLKVVWRKG